MVPSSSIVFAAVLILVLMGVAGAIWPVAVVGLGLLLALPLPSRLRHTGIGSPGSAPGGFPTTSDASYEPVQGRILPNAADDPALRTPLTIPALASSRARVAGAHGRAMGRNLDIVREVFDAFSHRDAQRLIAVAHPDIVFSPPTRNLANEGEPYLGHEGLRRYLADVAQVWQELRSEPTEFIEIGPDRVLCTGRVYAWGVGRVVDSPAGWVWRVKDDLLIEGAVYETRRAAYEAVGRPWPPPDG